jgi:hypothetical protein
MNKTTCTLLLILTLLVAAAAPALAESTDGDSLPVERYALYVASNSGGAGRETLKYAYTDATRLARTLGEIGGIRGENSLILSDPTPREINDAFADISALVRKNSARARRTEFIFYYSGHSDEKSFLLGKESFSYADLKAAIDRVPSDVHVVMLDSCYSGNFVRTKGGSRQKPFLMDDSSNVQGHAYLSSSSGFESSQESDVIQASYFTHALVTGLRGAADTSGDSKVSLNELYHYAFNETLSDTELSSAGPQHPSYDITLVGSGDLVLTDLSVAESVLHIGIPYEGRFFIRDSSGQLVSELNKTRGTEISLALPAGTYIISIVSGISTTQGTVTIAKGERLSLSDDSFVPVQKTVGRSRGGETIPPDEERYHAFMFTLAPGVVIPFNTENTNAKVSIGGLWTINDRISGVQANIVGGTINENLKGLQASALASVSSGAIRGVQASFFVNLSQTKDQNITALQASGVVNIANGYIRGGQVAGYVNVAMNGFYGGQVAGFLNQARGTSSGFQTSGFMNIAKDIRGAQLSPFLNVAHTVEGAQIGLINIAESNTGASIGILNFIQNGIMSPAIYCDSNRAMFIQFQGGTKAFYTTFLFGTDLGDADFAEFGFGIGTRVTIVKNLSCDFEILSKHLFNEHTKCPEGNEEDFDCDSNPDWEMPTEEDARTVIDGFGQNHIPSLRATVQYSFAKHFSAFIAAEAEMRFHGYNDEAFTEYGRHTLRANVIEDQFTVYPTYSLGIKF